MSVTVELSPTAARALERLHRADRGLYRRVVRALDRLAAQPDLGKPLHGPLAGRRSHRVGALRILYRFESERLVVVVLDLGQRGRVTGERPLAAPLGTTAAAPAQASSAASR